jgi:nucleoside 2-deoxyribosyltransferase
MNQYNNKIMTSTVFISYRFSDVPRDRLEQLIPSVCDTVKEMNVDVWCNYFFDSMYLSEQYTPREIMQHCFDNLDKHDTVFCLLDTKEPSCGMLIELGYAFAQNKDVIVFCNGKIDKSRHTTVLDMAKRTHYYVSDSDLMVCLKKECKKLQKNENVSEKNENVSEKSQKNENVSEKTKKNKNNSEKNRNDPEKIQKTESNSSDEIYSALLSLLSNGNMDSAGQVPIEKTL